MVRLPKVPLYQRPSTKRSVLAGKSRVYYVNRPTSQWNMTIRTKGGSEGRTRICSRLAPRERQLAFHLRVLAAGQETLSDLESDGEGG